MERRLATLFAADVVGFTRLRGAYESGTIVRHRRPNTIGNMSKNRLGVALRVFQARTIKEA